MRGLSAAPLRLDTPKQSFVSSRGGCSLREDLKKSGSASACAGAKDRTPPPMPRCEGSKAPVPGPRYATPVRRADQSSRWQKCPSPAKRREAGRGEQKVSGDACGWTSPGGRRPVVSLRMTRASCGYCYRSLDYQGDLESRPTPETGRGLKRFQASGKSCRIQAEATRCRLRPRSFRSGAQGARSSRKSCQELPLSGYCSSRTLFAWFPPGMSQLMPSWTK